MPMATPNKQQILEKFTKLAGASCYNINVKVEFCYYMTDGFKVWAAECDISSDIPTIRFNGAIFRENELNELAWYTLLHEVSHLKFQKHNDEFWNEVANNFELTMDLRKQFYEETGLEDNYEAMDYTPYFDDVGVPDDAEVDEECLEHEDEFFEVYNIFKLD